MSKKLYDYNTSLTNDDRSEIADHIEVLEKQIEDMKDCKNCNYNYDQSDIAKCNGCFEPDLRNWVMFTTEEIEP